MVKAILLAAAAAATLPVSAPAFAAVQVVNLAAIDTTQPNDVPAPVTVAFGPGTYNVAVVGTPGGGTYDAWGVATPSAGNWDERYNYTIGGVTTSVNPFDNQRFATAPAALAAFSGVISTFTLNALTDVTFSIPDYLWVDNAGGVSLGVSPVSGVAVPEPGMLALFAMGVGMLLYYRRSMQREA